MFRGRRHKGKQGAAPADAQPVEEDDWEDLVPEVQDEVETSPAVGHDATAPDLHPNLADDGPDAGASPPNDDAAGDQDPEGADPHVHGFVMPNAPARAHPEHDDHDEGPATVFDDGDQEKRDAVLRRLDERANAQGDSADDDALLRRISGARRVASGAAEPVSAADVAPEDGWVVVEEHEEGVETDAHADAAEPDGGWIPLDDGVQVSGEPVGADGVVADQHTLTETIKNHRFGLRFGEHQKGDLLGKLRDVLGLKSKDAQEDASVETVEPEVVHELERVEPNDRYREIETYPIHPPYASIRILYDEENKEHIYQVLEPELSITERQILDFVEETMVDTLTVAPGEVDEESEADFITQKFNDVIFDYSIILHEDEAEEDAIKQKLLYYIHRDFIGHGPLDAMMEDPYIEDISCDGPALPIFLYHRRYESMRSTVVFHEHDELDSYVIKMAQRSGKHISIAEPILDATMTDGSRLQSTLGKEVSAGGSTFTIRKFRPDPFTPPDLVLFRTMSAEMLAYLWIAVQHGSSILYAGGTASGKTTSLNAILLFIPPQMKIVSIEDTREVNLPHENWIAGITRTGFGPRDQNGRQAGEIDMFQLLKNALRQRPEYIVVGEVRGQEAYSLFQAMATGHAAYGTMHADSVDAVIHRLESDPINIPRALLEALDVVSVQIQTRVNGKRVRRTKQISEIVGIDPHTREVLTNEVFRWVPKDDSFKFSGVSYTLERIQVEKGLPGGAMLQELKRRAEIIRWMIDHQIQDYKQVSKVVSGYYREPETIMGLVRGEIDPSEVSEGLRVIAMQHAEDGQQASVAEADMDADADADAHDESDGDHAGAGVSGDGGNDGDDGDDGDVGTASGATGRDVGASIDSVIAEQEPSEADEPGSPEPHRQEGHTNDPSTEASLDASNEAYSNDTINEASLDASNEAYSNDTINEASHHPSEDPSHEASSNDTINEASSDVSDDAADHEHSPDGRPFEAAHDDAGSMVDTPAGGDAVTDGSDPEGAFDAHLPSFGVHHAARASAGPDRPGTHDDPTDGTTVSHGGQMTILAPPLQLQDLEELRSSADGRQSFAEGLTAHERSEGTTRATPAAHDGFPSSAGGSFDLIGRAQPGSPEAEHPSTAARVPQTSHAEPAHERSEVAVAQARVERLLGIKEQLDQLVANADDDKRAQLERKRAKAVRMLVHARRAQVDALSKTRQTGSATSPAANDRVGAHEEEESA